MIFWHCTRSLPDKRRSAGEQQASANREAMKTDLAPLLLGVTFAVCASTIGDLLIAKGMQKVGAITWKGLRAIPGQLLAVVRTPQIPLAVAFMAVFFFTWLALLSRADLSLILPMTAITAQKFAKLVENGR